MTKTPFKILSSSFPSSSPSLYAKKLEVFLGGSVHALKEAEVLSEHEKVLYFGDNLYADLVQARYITEKMSFSHAFLSYCLYFRRCHGWQTACVLSELDAEIRTQNTASFQRYHRIRIYTRHLLENLQQQKNYSLQPIEWNLITDLETQLFLVNEEMSSSFHPNFGSVFRTNAGAPTLFALDIRRYVDLYTSHISNVLNYSTSHRFFPSHSIHMVSQPFMYRDFI